jgi:DNA-binding transcriptional LysR family regulator
VRVRGTVRSNIGEALKKVALMDAGIAVHPYYMVAEELRSGALQVVLPQHIPQELDIYAVFSTRRHMPVRVRALLEFLKEWAANPPPWALPQPQATPVAAAAAPARQRKLSSR